MAPPLHSESIFNISINKLMLCREGFSVRLTKEGPDDPDTNRSMQ
jgi:hypothetical protein